MKRREFLVTVCKIAPVLGIQGAFCLDIFNASNNLKLKMDAAVTELPLKPEEYSTIISFKVEKLPHIVKSHENIQGQSQNFIITKPGDYSIQYLGPYFGWNFV